MTVIDTRSRLKMIQLPQSMHSFQMTAKKVAGKHTNTPQCELAMVCLKLMLSQVVQMDSLRGSFRVYAITHSSPKIHCALHTVDLTTSRSF